MYIYVLQEKTDYGSTNKVIGIYRNKTAAIVDASIAEIKYNNIISYDIHCFELNEDDGLTDSLVLLDDRDLDYRLKIKDFKKTSTFIKDYINIADEIKDNQINNISLIDSEISDLINQFAPKLYNIYIEFQYYQEQLLKKNINIQKFTLEEKLYYDKLCVVKMTFDMLASEVCSRNNVKFTDDYIIKYIDNLFISNIKDAENKLWYDDIKWIFNTNIKTLSNAFEIYKN